MTDTQAHGPLRGHVRLQLLRDLAAGDLSLKALGEKYDRNSQTIATYRDKYAEEIAQIVASADDAVAGLWTAQKANRVAAYQQDVETAEVYLSLQEQLGYAPDPQVTKSKQAALKAIAEELGQLVTKTEGKDVVVYRVAIDGVSAQDLQ